MIDADEINIMNGPLTIAAAEVHEISPNPKRHETEELLTNHPLKTCRIRSPYTHMSAKAPLYEGTSATQRPSLPKKQHFTRR